MSGGALQAAVVVGRFGERQLLSGWHERQVDECSGVPYRASDGAGVVRLAPAPGARTLCLLMSGPAGLEPLGLEGAVRIGERIFPMKLKVDAWVYRQFPLVDALPSLEVGLFAPNPPVPDRVLHNGDARRLGFYLSAIWQEA